jgi:hypothetical protein
MKGDGIKYEKAPFIFILYIFTPPLEGGDEGEGRK